VTADDGGLMLGKRAKAKFLHERFNFEKITMDVNPR